MEDQQKAYSLEMYGWYGTVLSMPAAPYVYNNNNNLIYNIYR